MYTGFRVDMGQGTRLGTDRGRVHEAEIEWNVRESGRESKMKRKNE